MKICKEVIDAWVSYFLIEQLVKINKLNVGLGYWGCNMYEQETIRIKHVRAEFEAKWRRGHRTTTRHVEFPPKLQEVQNLASWVCEAIQSHIVQGVVLEDQDALHLLVLRSLFASRYTKMKAYGNHYRVFINTYGNTSATYDYGVASIFHQEQQSTKGTRLGALQYVGISKDIILLDYGLISQPVILFKCDWVRNGLDRWGNATYMRDDDGFLLVKFRQLKARVDEPYVFPAQVQQVFYANDPNMPRWKVVLHKEPRSKRILVSDSDEVTMLDNLIGVDVPLEILEVPRNMALVGASELTGADAILAVEKLQRSSGDGEVGLE